MFLRSPDLPILVAGKEEKTQLYPAHFDMSILRLHQLMVLEHLNYRSQGEQMDFYVLFFGVYQRLFIEKSQAL